MQEKLVVAAGTGGVEHGFIKPLGYLMIIRLEDIRLESAGSR